MKRKITTALTILAFLVIFVMFSACGGGGGGSGSETLKLSGHVQLENGSPVPGVTVVFSWPALGSQGGGGPLSRTTNINGYYIYEYGEIFDDEPVTITPHSDTYTFSPPEYALPSAGDGYSDLDFIANENLFD